MSLILPFILNFESLSSAEAQRPGHGESDCGHKNLFGGGGGALKNLSVFAPSLTLSSGNSITHTSMKLRGGGKAISRNVVGKSERDNPERYCGWFWVHCFSEKFEWMTREAMVVCLRVLKESKKSRVRQPQRQEQCIDHIPYYLSGFSHAHFFRQPLSK